MILFLAAILSLHDFISQSQDVITLVSSRSTLIRWTVYDALIVSAFFIYSNFAVTNAAFVYFQF